MKVKWEELPVDGRTRRWEQQMPAHQDVADRLKTRPGKWARVDTKDTPQAANAQAEAIRRGTLRAFRPAGDFTASMRTVVDEESGDIEYRVYAKYIG